MSFRLGMGPWNPTGTLFRGGDGKAGQSNLPRLPASWIAPAVEAGDYYNPMLLKLEEYAVREAAHARSATVPVDDGKLQWTFRDCLNRGVDC